MANYEDNAYNWLKRKGLAAKYEFAGIYCIKIDGEIEAGNALLIAPREKGFEGACVAVDAIGGEGRVPHTDNHCIQIRLLEHGNVHLYIHVPRHGLKLGLITLQGLICQSFCFAGDNEVFESFLNGCAYL